MYTYSLEQKNILKLYKKYENIQIIAKTRINIYN